MKTSYPNAEITLNKSSGGIFDVTCNGKLIYSKQNSEEKRFPNAGEITELIKKAIG
ncbi:MAG: Rdx family protein [Desulfamplus sp.]|nr:Rdx family protein [Desulfamplus sp.]